MHKCYEDNFAHINFLGYTAIAGSSGHMEVGKSC